MTTQTLEITLNPEIVAVDGVVNGESYAFTLTGSVDNMSIWSAAVTRAKDGIYRVSLTVVNSGGVSSQLSTIIYYGLHLITDRTQFDVDRVNELRRKGWANMNTQERLEWEIGLKGAYNATDLNRVQSAVIYLRERLYDFGYTLNISEKKTWTKQDFPTISEMDEYLKDVRVIRNVIAPMTTTPEVPDTMRGLTYIKANNIERVLLDADRLLSNMNATLVYSGEVFGGEER